MTRREIVKRPLAAIIEALPEMCFEKNPATGELVAIKRGEAGYHLASDSGQMGVNIRKRLVGPDGDHDDVDQLNKALGVTWEQSQAMMCGSMAGYDCPGADPLNYVGRRRDDVLPSDIFMSEDRKRGRQ